MEDRSGRGHRWLLTAAVFVVLWRLAAVAYPHPAADDPAPVRWAMAVMGLWFLGWGLWAHREAPGRPTFLLGLYAVTAGLHWGGPVGFGVERIDMPLLAFYFLASSLTADILVLHLSLAFPPAMRLAAGRPARAVLYLPVLLAVAALLALSAAGPSSGIGGAAAGLLGMLLPAGSLAALGGILIWLARPAWTSAEDRGRWRLLPVLGALIIGLVPTVVYVAGLDLGAANGWINLGFAPFPVALAIALARPRERGTA